MSRFLTTAKFALGVVIAAGDRVDTMVNLLFCGYPNDPPKKRLQIGSNGRGIAMTRLFKIAAVVIMLFLGLNLGTDLTFAADLPVVSGHSKVDAEMRLEEFAKGTHATCTAWTDGCRTCGRNPDGVFCSNVGIACQVSKPRCTRP